MIVVKENEQENNLTTKHLSLCSTTSFKQTNVILYRAQKAALLFSIILRLNCILATERPFFFFFDCHLSDDLRLTKRKKKKERKKERNEKRSRTVSTFCQTDKQPIQKENKIPCLIAPSCPRLGSIEENVSRVFPVDVARTRSVRFERKTMERQQSLFEPKFKQQIGANQNESEMYGSIKRDDERACITRLINAWIRERK